MVKEHMPVAEKLVHPDHVSEPFNDTDELGGFASIDELEDFLRNFSEGSETEASLATQGEADVGGTPVSGVAWAGPTSEPIHTVH